MNARVQTIVKSSSFPAKRSPRHNYKSILTKCSNSTFVTRFNFNNRENVRGQINQNQRSELRTGKNQEPVVTILQRAQNAHERFQSQYKQQLNARPKQRRKAVLMRRMV
ncbi:Hypothetical_protein [Hexamita inflata]|uniref:Hypothetical_protein n=1 Tax=Hexamita inflata TaxID=28002 RepID=A0AA86NE47_9EUKA|nr:Hypothetical protein HINF_LOCUS5737 [Hexamita inflata]